MRTYNLHFGSSLLLEWKMKINKKDMILIGGVLLLALIFWLIPFINQKKDSLQKEEQQGMLKITVDGNSMVRIHFQKTGQ